MTEASTAPDPPLTDAEPPVPEPRRTSRLGRVLHWAMALGLLAAVPFVYAELPEPGALWDSVSGARPEWLLVVAAGAVASMAMFARLQRRLLRIGGLRMSRRRAAAITFAGNALSTTLPAGPAVSVVYTFRQFRRGGASARLATAVIILGGVVTTTAYTVVGLVALLADPHARTFALAGLTVPAALALAAGAALARPGPRVRLARLARRAALAVAGHPRIKPWAIRLRDGFALLRPTRRDWGALLVLAVLNWVFDILALYAAAQAVGVGVSPVSTALVYFAAQAAGSALPILPGGLGAIESSMAASLVALGAAFAPAAAAVAVYRLASYWAIVAAGWLAWLVLNEGARVPARARAALGWAGRATLAATAPFGALYPGAPLPTSAEARQP
ncbi:lysylphosphatidylglycerol synthase transmembrane domain-containing protein [Actinomadura atramentaria]|uniref:lysylphosphatidylglycerol synthase transmembrane domain-containing protein n=1 Tax=Actinomadura atramentaria TaxID=1990 RepID=UPI0003619CB3|nr:YbhN family protein [Actinomadura atramentaria]